MNEISVFCCPMCDSRLRALAEFVGRNGNCPKCGARITIPPQIESDEGPRLVTEEEKPDEPVQRRRWPP